MRSNAKSDFRLFFAWTAFVLLPVNMFIGSLLAQRLPLSPFLISLGIGLAVTMFLSAPAIVLSQTNNWTFAQGIIETTRVKSLHHFVLIVPLINIGWYSIQTAAATHSIATYFDLHENYSAIAVAVGFLHAVGPLLFGYRWLSSSGAITCIILFSIAFPHITPTAYSTYTISVQPDPHIADIIWGVIMVCGSWVFSSTSCVMDVSRFGRTTIGTLCAIFLGTLIANGGLISIGYLLSTSAVNGDAISIFLQATSLPGFIFLNLALWSTNDSNLYSTMQAYRGLKLPAIPFVLISVTIASMSAAFWGPDLFGFIGNWLKTMGWIGVGLGVYWWWHLLNRRAFNNISSPVTNTL